ncbi:tetratricopeptide repeat protein [Crocosphaera chwakensis]|uniref:TPR repeat n=1 Tax=Crocosphaera chwakensis CCY0110 TaxID=391612 RepID=A3IZI8_9CHRO|nr:hypothetical protein [Crocosphaera chwakensis]EAZ88108.1 hypothetical protein CY0110_31585 [Crocosphaera chwakensis CCY0110]
MPDLFYRYRRSIVLFCLVALLVVTFPLRAVSTDDLLLNLNQAQKLIDQGNFNLASTMLESIEGKLSKQAYPYYQAITANLFLRQGLFNRAIDIYSSLYQQNFGEQTNNYLKLLDNYIQAILGRAKIYSFLASDDIERRDEFLKIVDSDRTMAIELATEAVQLSSSNSVREQIRAKLNLGKISDNLVDLATLTEQIESLSTSRDKAQFLLELAQLSPDSPPTIKKAVEVALEAQDPLSLSWTWKALGEYYEQKGLYEKALEASYRVIWASEEVQDWLGSIQGQWLSARVYEKLDQSAQANAAYRNAVNTVKTLRADLAG